MTPDEQPQPVAWPDVKTLDKLLWAEDKRFSAWVRSMPDKHWSKYDLSAIRLGYELGKIVAHPPTSAASQPDAVRVTDDTALEMLRDAMELLGAIGVRKISKDCGEHNACVMRNRIDTFLQHTHNAALEAAIRARQGAPNAADAEAARAQGEAVADDVVTMALRRWYTDGAPGRTFNKMDRERMREVIEYIRFIPTAAPVPADEGEKKT